MISYLKGILVSKIENSPSGCNITIEVNNIGYSVLTNVRTVTSLPEIGGEAIIHTSLVHKEDAMYLCGFANREDRDLFNILQTVSGIGTKVALLLLGELGAYELISAVISGNDKALSKTKGVGPKLAQRLILELKDKMINWRGKTDFIETAAPKLESGKAKESYLEAESVLLSLGYSAKEAKESLENALAKTNSQKDPEELLKLALQWLAQ